MSKHTFSAWLHNEVASARYALIALYEQRDRMKYVEAPRLENEYMNKIGSYEETVIKEEFECELLRKKQQMIQAAINRRESIDEAAIDAQLEKERQQMLSEASAGAPGQYANLSPEESDRLQELYREIVRNFHPQMHPELTEVHRQLFKKAQEAYKYRDLTALELIYDMLTNEPSTDFEITLAVKILTGDDIIEEYLTENRDYSTDYALAASIYDSFLPTVEEAAIKEERENYRLMTSEIMNEVEEMRTEFPFTAAEMLSVPSKIEEYKEKLTHRLRTATEERERRMREIKEMIESVASHG